MRGKIQIKLFFITLFIFALPSWVYATPMSTDEINNFLVSKSSWLANHTIAEYISVPYPIANGEVVSLEYVDARQAYYDTFYNKTVAQLIYEEAIQHDINPRLILVILQRESSAITQSTPSSTTRQAWPMFYNYDERMADCLNGNVASCNDIKYNHPTYRERAYDYGGVGQQIAYATAQLRNLHDNSGYCGGSLTVSVDGQSLAVDNAATCALYKYTPHEDSYKPNPNGVDGFYNIFNNWFGQPPTTAYSVTNIISEDNFKYTASTPPPAPTRKAGDANGDNAVDLLDLSILASFWGQNNADADFNHDGVVDLLDLSILADQWGK